MSSISAPYSQIALTVAALKALPPGLRAPNYCLFIPALGSWVYYSSTSTAADNNTTIFQPNDGVGRWIVTNQPAAPSGSGITKQPNIAITAATLTDLQRAVNQIISTLTAAGVTEPVSLTRNYDAANPTNDLINLLGTNNGAVAYASPHPSKISITASSTSIGSVATLLNRANGDWASNSVANSSVTIDFTTARSIVLTGIGLQSWATNTRYPVNVVIAGSNDGTTFTTINTWSSIGFTAMNQFRFTTFSNTTAYRYLRVSLSGLDSQNENFLTLGEIYLYGTLSAI